MQSINESVADREREQALREFYEGKIEHITTQAKASDSKAVQLYEQYSSLLKALEDKEAERNELLDKIKAADQETKTSKEDLGIHYFYALLFSLSSLLYIYIYYIVFWGGGEVSSLVVVGSNPAGVLFFYIFLYIFSTSIVLVLCRSCFIFLCFILFCFDVNTESTRTNYDTQLRLLSDHLLELGEKIIQLEAEASAIKVRREGKWVGRISRENIEG